MAGLIDRAKMAIGRRLAAVLEPHLPGLAAEIDPTDVSDSYAGEGLLRLSQAGGASQAWQVGRTRNEKHRLHQRMSEESALISKALDVTADVATAPEDDADDARSSFEVDCEDGRTQAAAERIVESLNLKATAWGISRRIIQHGNEMREVVLDSNASDVVRYKQLPEDQMWLIKDEFGVPRQPAPWEQRLYYQPPGSGIPFLAWQIVHYKYGDEDATYGTGILQCEREWMQLLALESSMVIGRLQRSPSKLLHLIPVDYRRGAGEVAGTIRAYRDSYLRHKALSATLGTTSMDSPPGAGDDIFFPHYGKEWEGAGVTAIDPSNTQLSNLRDVEYHRSQLLARLGVPIRYLNMGGAEAVRASMGSGGISHEDRQFARTIRRIQSVIAEGNTRVVNFGLILQGLNPVQYPVTLRFAVISTEDALLAAQVEKTRAETLAIVAKSLDLPAEFVKDRYLQLSADEKEQFEEEVFEGVRRQAVGENPFAETRHLKEIAASVLVMAESIASQYGDGVHLHQVPDPLRVARSGAFGADYPSAAH